MEAHPYGEGEGLRSDTRKWKLYYKPGLILTTILGLAEGKPMVPNANLNGE